MSQRCPTCGRPNCPHEWTIPGGATLKVHRPQRAHDCQLAGCLVRTEPCGCTIQGCGVLAHPWHIVKCRGCRAVPEALLRNLAAAVGSLEQQVDKLVADIDRRQRKEQPIED